MADLKAASEEIKDISKNIESEIPNEEKPKGLLARPEEKITDGN